MKKITWVIAIIALISISSKVDAQVTIGSGEAPEKAALLDIKTKSSDGGISSTGGGLMLPRVQIADVTKLDVFGGGLNLEDADNTKHIGLTVYNIGGDGYVDEGVYTWNGSKWVMVGGGIAQTPKFFYMPSIVIETSTPGDNVKNLYEEYIDQFLKIPESQRSPGSPESIKIYEANELYYYVTGYDEHVFTINSITEDGNLSYTVNQPAVDGTSYMNIVFVVK